MAATVKIQAPNWQCTIYPEKRHVVYTAVSGDVVQEYEEYREQFLTVEQLLAQVNAAIGFGAENNELYFTFSGYIWDTILACLNNVNVATKMGSPETFLEILAECTRHLYGLPENERVTVTYMETDNPNTLKKFYTGSANAQWN